MGADERTSIQLQGIEAQLRSIGEQMRVLIRIEVAIMVVILAWGVASLFLFAYILWAWFWA